MAYAVCVLNVPAVLEGKNIEYSPRRNTMDHLSNLFILQEKKESMKWGVIGQIMFSVS